MTATRVRYRERQLLRSNDLTDEQNYRLDLRRRHNIAHHDWGIVTGLTLEAGSGCVRLQPGLAVDGFGRELIVPESVPIPETTLDQLVHVNSICQAIDAWLLYARVAVTPPQRGRWDCGPGQHSRWREQADLRLAPVKTGGFIDPRQPPTVAAADLDFGAHQTSPDDPQREWPVYLGRILRTWLFRPEHLRDPAGLAHKLVDPNDLLSQHLRSGLFGSTEKLLAEYKKPGAPPEVPGELQSALVLELNKWLRDSSLFDKSRFAHISLRLETLRMITQEPKTQDLDHLNRLLLEDAFPVAIIRKPCAYDVIPSIRPYARLVGEAVAAPSGLGAFKITEQSLNNLKSAGLPDEVLEKLAALKNDEIVGEEEFLALLQKEIGDEALNEFGQKILQQTRGLVRMQVGRELRGDRRRFAVSLSGEKGAYADQLTIEQSGSTTTTTLRGNTALEGELSIGPLRFRTTDLSQPTRLIEKFQKPEEPLIAYLSERFSEQTNQLLEEYDGCSPPSASLRRALVDDLNQRLYDPELYHQDRFPSQTLRPATRSLIELLAPDVNPVILNRLLLEDAFPHELNRSQAEEAPPWGVEFGLLAAPPAGPAPWQIYHDEVSREDAPTINQLRMEIAHPGDQADPANYRLVIGHRDPDGGEFVPCLSVSADCTVTLHETACLKVEGKVIESPIDVNPDDPRFNAALLEAWRDALAESAANLDQLYRPLNVEHTVPMAVPAGQEQFDYTITVRNISGFSLPNVRIEGIEAPIRLDPRQSQALSRTFKPRRRLPPGEIVIESKATGVGRFGNPVEATGKASVFNLPLQVMLATIPILPAEQQTLDYTITLQNLSSFALSNVQINGVITILKDGTVVYQQSIHHAIAELDPGNQPTTRIFEIPVDITSGEIVIEIESSGNAPDGTAVIARAEASVLYNPLEVELAVVPVLPPDERALNYTITVRNNSTVAFDVDQIVGEVTVHRSDLSVVQEESITHDIERFDPGEQVIANTFEIPEGISSGSIVIIFEASAVGPEQIKVVGWDWASVSLNPLEIEIDAAEHILAAETTLDYRITLQNNSAVAYAPLRVSGTMKVLDADQDLVVEQSIDERLETLDPGPRDVSITFDLPPDLTSGEIVIKLEARGKAPDGTPVLADIERSITIIAEEPEEPEPPA